MKINYLMVNNWSCLFDVIQIFSFYSKYKEEHEKRFPPKGEPLKQRWIEF